MEDPWVACVDGHKRSCERAGVGFFLAEAEAGLLRMRTPGLLIADEVRALPLLPSYGSPVAAMIRSLSTVVTHRLRRLPRVESPTCSSCGAAHCCRSSSDVAVGVHGCARTSPRVCGVGIGSRTARSCPGPRWQGRQSLTKVSGSVHSCSLCCSCAPSTGFHSSASARAPGARCS